MSGDRRSGCASKWRRMVPWKGSVLLAMALYMCGSASWWSSTTCTVRPASTSAATASLTPPGDVGTGEGGEDILQCARGGGAKRGAELIKVRRGGVSVSF